MNIESVNSLRMKGAAGLARLKPLIEPEATLQPLDAKDFAGGAFAKTLARELKPLEAMDFHPGSKSPESADDQQARLGEQAQKWVAQTFYGTMLKQMRQSPFKSELFGGGRGGEVFGSLMDQQLVDHMAAGGADFPLARSIARKLKARLPDVNATTASSDPTRQLNEAKVNHVKTTR
jgi:hypothetical protein